MIWSRLSPDVEFVSRFSKIQSLSPVDTLSADSASVSRGISQDNQKILTVLSAKRDAEFVLFCRHTESREELILLVRLNVTDKQSYRRRLETCRNQ